MSGDTEISLLPLLHTIVYMVYRFCGLDGPLAAIVKLNATRKCIYGIA